MLKPEQPLAIFMEENLGDIHGKMGHGILRFSPNPVVCVVDTHHAGKRVRDVVNTPRDCPVVASMRTAAELGAEVLVLGIAPSGGRLPEAWLARIDEAVNLGMSVVNGLHNPLAARYPELRPGRFVWDIRQEPDDIGVGTGEAHRLRNKRVLVVGSDMACGKMTVALMVCLAARKRGVKADFVATGQIGMTIWGKGVPLDAIKLDYACGAVQKAVLDVAKNELIVVEGQGSLLHPGSSATLPLIRGACPTHLILCHRAGNTHIRNHPWIPIPPLRELGRLYEDLACTLGCLPPARLAGISLNTELLDEEEAKQAVAETSTKSGLPTTDVLRFGADCLVDALGFGVL